MGTGYTCIIEDNDSVTLRQFALRCARAFGACVDQRDHSLDCPPRAPEVSDYHTTQIAKARGRIQELEGIRSESARALWEAEYARVQKRNEEYARLVSARRAKYDAMRERIKAWSAPTSEHEGLREFMLEQIDRSYPDHDLYMAHAPASPDEYIATMLTQERRSIAYHEEEYAKELARVAERSAWIKSLVDSLPVE